MIITTNGGMGCLQRVYKYENRNYIINYGLYRIGMLINKEKEMTGYQLLGYGLLLLGWLITIYQVCYASKIRGLLSIASSTTISFVEFIRILILFLTLLMSLTTGVINVLEFMQSPETKQVLSKKYTL